MPLPSLPLLDLVQTALPWILLGAAIGIVHLASLRWTLALFGARSALARALLLQLLRFALVTGALALAAWHGTAALLAAAAALLLARMLLLRMLAPRGAAI